MNIGYRELREDEIDRELFMHFIRHQKVEICLRRDGDRWVERPDPFIDDWSEDEYGILIRCLRHTAAIGGFVYGAFVSDLDEKSGTAEYVASGEQTALGCLKGFVSVEPEIYGGENRYMDLSSIHVSEDMRRSGIGQRLFSAAADWAKGHGAKKLYISAHSAIESQRFYESLGCADAAWHDRRHVEAEPFDRQLEYVL